MWANTPAEGVKPVNSVRELEYLLDDKLATAQPIPYTLIQDIISANKNEVGSGGYGNVHLGVLGNGKKVAVKELVYQQKHTDDVLKREISCLMKARHHPNIARLVGYTADIKVKVAEDTLGQNSFTETRKRYLCLEFAPCGDLHDYIERMSVEPDDGRDPQANTKGYDDEADWTTYYQIIMGICNGLKHIHKQHIIHLDLKPKNILLDAYLRPKITDFGVSVCLTEEQPTSTTPGTSGFQAPEMLAKNEISYKSDIYALGATIVSLLMRNNSGDAEKWLEENLGAKNCPEEKRSFINIARNCMKPDPNERNTLEQTIKQLKEMGLEDLKIDDSQDVLKVISHSLPSRSTLNLVNHTGQHVAYKITKRGERYPIAIIAPRSTHVYDMPTVASEMILVRSTVIAKGIDLADIPADMFRMQVPGRRIYRVLVTIVVDEEEAQPSELLQLSTDTVLSPVIPGPYNGPLDVHPLELCFDNDRTMICSLQLTNNDSYNEVAFRIQHKKSYYPDMTYGVLLPMSACTVVLTNPEKTSYVERIQWGKSKRKSYQLFLQSIVCNFQDTIVSLQDESGCNKFFEKNKDKVHKVPLKVLYATKGETTSQLLSPSVPRGIEITSLTKTSVSKYKYPPTAMEAHPTMPWTVAICDYDNDQNVQFWNYETQSLAGSFDVMKDENDPDEISEISSLIFIPRESWLIFSDSRGRNHVYSYISSEMKMIDVFWDGIGRSASRAVHPTKPYLLSAYGVGKITLLDWTNGWRPKATFQQYPARVTQVVFNPNTADSFASASEDGTVQLWYIDSPRCYHTLWGHEGIVNCLAFFTCDDKQCLITGSNDRTAKIWDLQERTCIHTMNEFASPVVCVFAHPNLPVLITGTKTGTVHVWSSSNFSLQRMFVITYGGKFLNLALACSTGSTRVVVGQENAISIMDFGDEADIKREGQKELETLKCGEPEPKAGKDITQSLPVSLEHLRPPEKKSSVSEPSLETSSVTTKRKFRFPVKFRKVRKFRSRKKSLVTTVLATGSEDPTSVEAINKIDQLLSKIDKLAQKVPTTGERLSRISRIFPHGHGRCEEAIKEATDYDVGVLECLKLATGYIRDSFVKLGKKQDTICREFEKEDAYVETDMTHQDVVVASVAAAEKAKSAETSGDARAAKYKEEDKDTEESLYANSDNDINDDNETSEEGTHEDNIESSNEVATLSDQDAEESLSSNNDNTSDDNVNSENEAATLGDQDVAAKNEDDGFVGIAGA